MNILDRLIETVAPSWARSRNESRRYLSALRAYDAATTGHRAGGWVSASDNHDGAYAARMGLPALRARSRDLCRNNGYGVRAQTVIMNCVVGPGIKPMVTAGAQRRQTAVEKMLEDLLDENRGLDWQLENTLSELQDLAICGLFESGEVLVRRVWLDSADRKGSPLPFRIQILEPDFLDLTMDQTGDVPILGGIEYDSKGRRVAYHLHRQHPGAEWSTGIGYQKSVRVPARDILHLLDTRRRPGTGRGVPVMTPVILKMRDHAEFGEAVLLRQKMANCYSGFVENGLDGPNPALDKTKEGSEIDILEPATLQHLRPGEKVVFSSPPGAPDHGKYDSVVLHEIATSIGITYEALSGDLSGVNYSSGRMGRLNQDANIRRLQRKVMIGQLLAPLTRWIVQGMELNGRLPGSAGGGDIRVKWTPPAQPIVDPGKEIRPIKEAVRAGLQSPQQALLELGRNPEDVLDEIEAWNKELDKRGIKLDSDARYLSSNGVNAGIDEDADAGEATTNKGDD